MLSKFNKGAKFYKDDDIRGQAPYVCGDCCIGKKSVSISEDTMQQVKSVRSVLCASNWTRGALVERCDAG